VSYKHEEKCCFLMKDSFMCSLLVGEVGSGDFWMTVLTLFLLEVFITDICNLNFWFRIYSIAFMQGNSYASFFVFIWFVIKWRHGTIFVSWFCYKPPGTALIKLLNYSLNSKRSSVIFQHINKIKKAQKRLVATGLVGKSIRMEFLRRLGW
jgi:hypothetical protein